MIRPLHLLVAHFALLALVAAGCSDSTLSTPVREWVDGLCRAAATYQSATDAAGNTLANADLADTEGAKAAFARAIDQQRAAQKAFRSAFDDLGQPEIDGGKQVVRAFHDQFAENTTRTDDIARRVAEIPDSADFLTAFLDIADTVEAPDFRARLQAVARDHAAVGDLIATIDADPDCAAVIFQTDTPSAAEVEKEAWVSGICTALGGWVAAISTGADRLASDIDAATSPDEVERLLVEFFQQGLADTRTFQRDVGRLSPPPVGDGQAIHAVFVTASDDLVAAMERLTREAANLDFTALDQAIAESNRLTTLIDQLFGDVADSFDELQRYDPEGLDVYFQTLPECQF